MSHTYSPGFVRINRISVDRDAALMPKRLQGFAHHFLLEGILRSNWESGWCAGHDTPLQLERGQFVMGLSEMAARLNCGVQTVRSILKKLTTPFGLIRQNPTNRGTVITLLRFDSYTNTDSSSNKQPTICQQPVNNSEEDKKNKKKSTDSYEASDDAKKAVALWHEHRPLNENHWPTYWKVLDDLHRLDKVPWNSSSGIIAIITHAVTVWGQQHIQSPSKLRLRSRSYPEKKTWEVIQGQLQEPSVPQHAPITWADKRLRELREQRTEQETKDATERRP